MVFDGSVILAVMNQSADRAVQSLASIEDIAMSQYLDAFEFSVSDKLTALEAGVALVLTPPQLSDILRETMDARAAANKDRWLGLTLMPLKGTKM